MAAGQIWTNVGQAYAIDLLDPNTRGAQSTSYFGAWGSGSNTPAITDTALQTEAAPARASIPNGSITQITTESTDDTIQWVFSRTAAGTVGIQEVGVFSALTGGILHVRIVHGLLSLESGDVVTYTIRLRLAEKTEFCP